MKKNRKKAAVMVIILGVFLLLAAFGRFFAPNDPYETNLSAALLPPSFEFPMGTDHLGRCILSRILEGAAASVYSSLLVVAAVFVIGTTIGLAAGYFGGAADKLLMKVTVVFQAFPSFILAVAVAGMLGPGLKNAMLSLGLMYWTTYARLSRSLVLQIKKEPFIQAARLCDLGTWRILWRHVLPNVAAPLFITAALDVGNVILSMAGLSFLGLGVQAPLAEWGLMISNGRSYLQTAPWCIFFPSMALLLAVILFNLTGDKVRDALEDGGEA